MTGAAVGTLALGAWYFASRSGNNAATESVFHDEGSVTSNPPVSSAGTFTPEVDTSRFG